MSSVERGWIIGVLFLAACGATVDTDDSAAEWSVADAVWIGAADGDGPTSSAPSPPSPSTPTGGSSSSMTRRTS